MNTVINSTSCCCPDGVVSKLIKNTTLYLMIIVMPAMAFSFATILPQTMPTISTTTYGCTIGDTVIDTGTWRVTNKWISNKLNNIIIKKTAHINLT